MKVLYTFILCGSAFALYQGYRVASYKFSELVSAIKGVARLADQIEAARKEAGEIPEFMRGLIKICVAQTNEIALLRKAVAQFTSVVTLSAEQKAGDATESYDEGKADLTYATQQYMAEGLSPAEAKIKVDIDEQSKLYNVPFVG